MKLKLTKKTLVDFRYMYDEFDCGDEKLWYEKGEVFSGKIIVDRDANVDIKLGEDMVTDEGKIVKNLHKDCFEIIEN